MRALVVGLGSIGKRHAANLRRLVPDASIIVWHQRARRPSGPGELPLGCEEVFRLGDALERRPELAVIASPASLHIPAALALAEYGVHLLIEKPLSDRTDGVDQLLQRCRQRHLAVLVGYTLRFHEPLQVMHRAIRDGRIGRLLYIRAEVGQYLPDWRKGADYRESVSARSELGGGALLELSHEIDYVRWLAGDVVDVGARIGRLSDLEIDVEDTAEISLGFRSGAIGSIHLDMLQRAPARSCRVIGSGGTLDWDGMTNRLRWYSSAAGTWTDLCGETARDRNEMYIAELRHFLQCVDGSATPAVTGEDALGTLEIVLAAREASASRRTVLI